MSEWRECKLGECIEVVNGYAFKSQNFLEEQIENSLPVVKIKNVANGDVNLNAVQYHIYDKSLEKYLIQNGDVLVALTGNHPQAITQVVGEASKFKLNKLALLNQRVAKIKPKQNMSNNFLYYFLKDDSTHDYLANQSSGSANQANISKSDIENMPISLPPLEEQKAIAEVLSSLDDKIDLLHRQNRTLESLAQTLFRQWFIEEAKEEWEVGTLDDILDFNPSYKLKQGELATYLAMESVQTDRSSANGWYKREVASGAKFMNNDTLLARITPSLENGKTAFVDFLEDDEIGWGSTEFIVMRMKNGYHPFISYLIARNQYFRDFAIGNMTGSTGRQRAQAEDLKKYEIAIPPFDEVQKLNKHLEPIPPKIKANWQQIQTLENLRDTLLPKLLSGEVRVEKGKTI